MKKILTVPSLDVYDKLAHGFTTRQMGDNLNLIAGDLKMSPAKIFTLEQTHSAEVIFIDKTSDSTKPKKGDALITNQKDVVIGVRTADCLPILVYDRKAEVVAAIHAGWRGLVGGVVQKTLSLMIRRLGCKIENMEFAFGPCISDASFEVGPEVIEAFREAFGMRFSHRQKPGEKAHIDLISTARMSCEDIGFYHRNLGEVGLCTFEREDLFFSHRRKPGEGRQFNFIGMLS
jgi:YfiH family protein